ncbi:hypothetical protein SAMN06265379_103176 [Saccharicrinis carchari]|uniref:Uncharacterized protein n=1 Tax=Saccharicrinis carchari TaxID=1168039 RepID=A0A521CI47_SACCC|nr:hypothetical protein [Saccharicrinis carchari]SMO59127.1 hypothetical protein SAMN06265379_103176 [Saccharicrinis carchari]
MDKQSFNLNADFWGGYTGIFIKIVFAVILFYGFILLLNFFRDKFLNKENISKDPKIVDLLSILNKLFYLSGFGFVIANILQIILSQITRNSGNKALMNLKGDWDYLTFGIILIFAGIGFKIAKEVILKENQD